MGEENGSAHHRGASQVAENEIFKHFGLFDSDHDGSLSKDQFHQALAAKPFELPFLQREKLHRYMDVDGDGTIDVEEFASAIFGRPPPALDKSYISLLIEQIELDTELLVAKMPQCHFVRASIDFMAQHRGGMVDQSVLIQQASQSRALSEGCVVLNHEQVW
jgi:hypothetical protein